MKKLRPGRTAGFTLLELLVVLAILGLLYAIVGPRVIKYLGSSTSQTAAIQTKMSQAVLKTIHTDSFRTWLISQGIAPIEDGSPAAFKKVHEADLVRWAKIVKESGAQVD